MRVYCILNLVNGKVYIGKTCHDDGSREAEHFRLAKQGKNHCPCLYNAIRHYGEKMFHTCLLSGYAPSLDDLNAQEKHYIQKYRANEPEFGYNLTSGGDGADYWTGRKRSLESVEKIRLAHLGKKQSSQTIATRSKAMLGNKNCLGRTQSAEERRMRSLASPRKGVPCSEEQRRNLSIRNSGQGGKLSALGRKWIHNPSTGAEKLVLPDKVSSFTDMGWRIGGSPVRIARMAQTKTGSLQSSETIIKRAAKLRGQVRTDEQCRNISKAAKQRGVPPRVNGRWVRVPNA
jgi:group I intron endonuclease